jgi:membrane-bound hydrogenase subunit beta
MTEEETFQSELVSRFPFLEGKIRVQRARRLWVEAPQDRFAEILDHLYKNMKVLTLASMTGLDLGESLGIIYHLARNTGLVVNVQVSVPKARPVVQTVTGLFPAADCYEREVVDLLGFQVEGLPEGHRYPLPDDWPAGQYPLRKDWKAESLASPPAGEGGQSHV